MAAADDYARFTSQPRPIVLDGVQYPVPRLRPSLVGELGAWLKEAVPNPRDEARRHMAGLPDDVAKHVWTLAVEEARHWPPTLFSERGTELLLTTFEGQVRLVHALLRRGVAGFTLDAARDLADRLDQEDFERLFEAALPGEVGDPKAPAAGTTATTPTPTPTADPPPPPAAS
jgi:hypothetical protein